MVYSNPISLLIYILIAGLIVYAVLWFVNTLALPPPVTQIIKIIIAIVALIWLLRLFGFGI